MTVAANLIKQTELSVNQGNKSYRQTYIVEDDTDPSIEITFTQADAVTPSGLDTYLGVGISSKTVRPAQDLDKTTFIVDVTFSTNGGGQEEEPEDPTERRAVISWNWGTEEKEFYIDTAGVHVQNSAGQYLDPLPRKLFPKNMITYSKVFYSHIDVSQINTRCNNGPVLIDGVTFGANTLLCVGGTEAKRWESLNGVLTPFYEVSITLAEHRVEEWTPDWTTIKYLDFGLNELVDGKPQPILDAAGDPVQVPHPLDGNGAAASGGPEGPAELLTFGWYESANFPLFPD